MDGLDDKAMESISYQIVKILCPCARRSSKYDLQNDLTVVYVVVCFYFLYCLPNVFGVWTILQLSIMVIYNSTW